MKLTSLYLQEIDKIGKALEILVPCYRLLYETALGIIPAHRDRELRMLDFASFGGKFGSKLLAKFPRGHLTVIEQSAIFLKSIEQNFSQESVSRVTLQRIDYQKDGFSGRFDLAVSSPLFRFNKEKQLYYDGIFQGLESGGIFIHADHIAGDSRLAQKMQHALWLEHVGKYATSQQLAAITAEFDLEGSLNLETHKKYMRNSGFTEVTTWIQAHGFALFSGIK